MPFGANLKRLLKAKGMTVTELASLSGLKRGTLYSYLRRDTKKVDPVVINKLIEVLGPEASILYDVDSVTDIIWDEMPKNVSDTEAEIIMKLRAVDSFGVNAVQAVLNIEYARCTQAEE